jgi:diguanylate cyclase (GGDEF)-like protein/PAS domain S-box-containing protein
MGNIWRKFNKSIVTSTLFAVALRISLVIALLTGISYLMLYSKIETNKLAELQAYTQERAERESQLFTLAEDNHRLLKQDLLDAYQDADRAELLAEFEHHFIRQSDGAIRNAPDKFDGRQQSGVWLASGVELTEDVRLRTALFYRLATQYGKSWRNRFINTYLMGPENLASNFWPDIPDFVYRIAADFDIREQEYFAISTREQNPNAETVWTGLYRDIQADLWMVSVETPVYFQERHIATIGNDMALDELLTRAIAMAPKGGYNMIFRDDGRLVAHPHFIERLKSSDENFMIARDGSPKLRAIFQAVTATEPGQALIELTEFDSYILVSRIQGPDWFYISVIPRSVVTELASSTAAMVFLFGFIALAFELLLLCHVMKRKITWPLAQLTRATLALARGHDVRPLSDRRPDELGRLARSFNSMSRSLKDKDARLAEANEALQGQLLQLQQGQQSLDHAQSVAQLGSWDYRPHSGELNLSLELIKLLRLTREDADELDLQGLLRRLNPHDQESVSELLQAFCEQGSDFHFSQPIALGESRHCFFHVTGEALKDPDGTIRQLSGTVQDISEQYLTQQTLRESELLFRNAFHNSPISMAIVDLQGAILQANDNMCKTFGYSQKELNSLNFVSLVHPLDQYLSQEKLEDIATGSCSTYDAERMLVCKDGTRLWGYLKVFVQKDPKGQPDYIFIQCMDITLRKQAEIKLNQLAFHDPLTQLANRTLFVEFLEKAIKQYQRDPRNLFALLFLDLDGFKLVNDSLGHLEGDKLLIAITQRLQEEIRESDTLSRFGGDEFCILINDVQNEQQVTDIARRINHSLARPFLLGCETINTNASIGIIIASEELNTPQEYLRDADSAMYHAKQQGRGRYALFNADMHRLAKSQLRLRNELNQALIAKEFVPYFQAIVNTASGRICGFEALARWQHPQRGILTPVQFLGMTEEIQRVAELDYLILDAAMTQIVKLRNQFARQDLSISCNSSSELISNPKLVDRLKVLLNKHALPPGCLNVEVTESVLIKEPEITLGILHELQRLGVNIHLDDFGTGFSSLSYLHKFPIHNIKIDRSFISRLMNSKKDHAIVESIVLLARRLGIDVTAEGVETFEQYDKLERIGVNRTQGFYHSRPLNMEGVCALLQQDPLIALRQELQLETTD